MIIKLEITQTDEDGDEDVLKTIASFEEERAYGAMMVFISDYMDEHFKDVLRLYGSEDAWEFMCECMPGKPTVERLRWFLREYFNTNSQYEYDINVI